MAVCSYCGRYHDPSEWPEQFRTAYTPNCCFHCYEENPSRSEWAHVDEPESEPDLPPPEEPDDEDDVEIAEDPDPTDGDAEDI